MLQSLLFIAIAGVAFFIAGKQFLHIRRNILLGKDFAITGDTSQRWRNMFLIAFGQKKMFARWVPAIFHFFIYAAFLLTQIELIEIFIDGIFGTHRFFANTLGTLYTFTISMIEILSLLAFVATIVFLSRRNIIRLARFQKPEMAGWPSKDANLILLGEIMLIIGVFSMNGADVCLQKINPSHYIDTGTLAVSSWLGPSLFGGLSEGALHLIERFGWWLHALTVFAFINYLPYSKHLHIFLAFPNTYYGNLDPKGKMTNMSELMYEIKSMMGISDPDAPPPAEIDPNAVLEFGSNDITNLTWKNLLDAYTCTECGRCTSVCPANLTGKKLSPRKIMMDTRDRADEVGKKINSGDIQYVKTELKTDDTTLNASNFSDGRSLFDYISTEEINACTTCNACVDACPVSITPLDIILKLRRYQILTLSSGPTDWIPMFTSIENTGAVWQMPVERQAWIADANK